MKTRILLIVGLMAFTSVAFGQKGENLLNKLKESLPDNELYKNIRTQKTEAEELVKRLKTEGEESSGLKRKYKKAKDAYDEVLDAIAEDVNNINTIGGLTEELIMTKSRREEYEKLAKKAEDKLEDFMLAGYEALDDKRGFPKVIIDFALGFLPQVSNFTNALLEKVQDAINIYLDSLRFEDWDDI